MDRVREIRARQAARTAGRWSWAADPGKRQLLLVAIATEQGKLPAPVMDAARWGNNAANVRFYVNGEGIRADKLFSEDAEIGEMKIKHPDAAFIAHSAEDIEFLLGEVDRLSALASKRLRLLILSEGISAARSFNDWLRRWGRT